MKSFRHAEITISDERRLEHLRIFSSEDLWTAVGEDFDGGIEALSRRAHIPRDRLIEILVSSAINEPFPGTSAWRRWLAEHFMDGFVLFFLVLIGVLILRAHGGLAKLPAPWGLRERVPIASHDLRQGQTIGPTDLVGAWLNTHQDSVVDRHQIIGRRVLHPIRSGEVISPQNLGTK